MGATLVWRPMLLGAVFKAIGTADAPILTWSEAKRSYFFKDLGRWGEHYGVPFRFPSRFPMMMAGAARVVCVAGGAARGVHARDVSRVLGRGSRHQ